MSLSPGVALFRRENPSRRNSSWVYISHSGSSRRVYHCAACRAQVASFCAKWPITVQASEAIATHADTCQAAIRWERRAVRLAARQQERAGQVECARAFDAGRIVAQVERYAG